MNTNRRAKKRDDVVQQVSNIWNNRLSALIRDRFGSQKSFANAFKEKYGTGNQADVSRWVNVGTTATKGEVIGFPSYDTMRRIADLFGVTVGYLTGETDYESFELERACEYLGLTQSAAHSIERITKLKCANRLERYEKINYGKALCYLLSAENFEDFIGGICQYAEAVHQREHPIDYMEQPEVTRFSPDILDLAYKHRDDHIEEDIDNEYEVTDDVIEAIHAINDAEDKDYKQAIILTQNVKLAKFDLQERYQHLIEEVCKEENLEKIQAHYYETFSSIAELKKRIEESET